jgi:hypothetical protein
VKFKRSFAVLLTIVIGAALTACASAEEQVATAVQTLKNNGHKIDQVPGERNKLVNYARWETEQQTTVVEVVVVIPKSNCKVEMQIEEDAFGSLGAPYADEGRDKNGKEMDLPGDFPTDNPSPEQLEDYLTKGSGKDMFAFCANESYAPSKHSDD